MSSMVVSLLALLGCREHETQLADVTSAAVTTAPVQPSSLIPSSSLEVHAPEVASPDLAELIKTRRWEAAWQSVQSSRPSWLEESTHLVLGYLAAHTERSALALEHLQHVENSPRTLEWWLNDMRARALLDSPEYTTHSATVANLGAFDVLTSLVEKLLSDGAWERAERLLVEAQRRASDDEQRGDVRWLRARLRHAQGRPALATGDVRWLVVSHPGHHHADAALEAINAGWFAPLLPREHLARAQAAAEVGLFDVVRSSVTALGSSRWLSDGERAYLLGLAAYRSRNYAQAVPLLDDAVQRRAARSDHARFLAASAAAKAGDPSDALERMTAISKSKPATETVEQATFQLGHQASLLGSWQAATEHYTTFLTAFPNSALVAAAHRERLVAWFAQGNDRRFVHWVRVYQARWPEAREGLLLRCLEASALRRLGHHDLANDVWREVARMAPLSFAGAIARLRLAEGGIVISAPVADAPDGAAPSLTLPAMVEELDRAGLTEQAESALRAFEPELQRQYATRGDATLCDAYGQLDSGRRRYELGREAGKRRGLADAPQLVPFWLWKCLYPTPYGWSMHEHASRHGVDEALAYAVMRQESGFLPRVESPAGARGLMQIIQPTARKIAAELGQRYDAKLLDSAHFNIEYGVFYLSKLQDHFRHPALVAAAYNAGPDAASRWFSAVRDLPLEVFVLRIPYDETRSYVQRVLENWLIYGVITDGKARQLTLTFDATNGPAPALENSHRAPEGFY